MIKKEWRINNNNTNKPLIERLLSVRGIKRPDEIEEFLNPYEINLTSPNAFCDMSKAVRRIERAITNNERILIYGDFDADGITSTSLLLKTLKYLGADVDYYIPARERSGHGLNTNNIVKLMSKICPKLIITVDCGISNREEVAFINSFNRDVIITDHHEAPKNLPAAFAIINPKAENSLDKNLTVKELNYLGILAGVGVAFKLAQGVLEKYKKTEFLTEILPFAAIGTIADVVPLIGENRYFVVKGLELISKGKHYGITKLLESAGYKDTGKRITSELIAFGAAPRINACGRLNSADDKDDPVKNAIKVLTSSSKSEIDLSVLALENFNKIRQELCSRIFLEADEMAIKSKDNMLVLYKKDWHIGIIGIAASKLVDKYGKPAFLMTYSEDTSQIRCSARGVENCEEINLYNIISNLSDKLEGFGGHALAAGLYFDPKKHSFEEIKSELLKSYNMSIGFKKPQPVLNIDMEIDTDTITEDLIKDIARLEPFGASNPSPVFVVNGFRLVQKKLMGNNNEHLKLIVEKNGQNFTAIWWSFGDIGLKPGDSLDMAFSPQLNNFNGNTTIQLIIKDIHSDSFTELRNSKKIPYDNRKKTDIVEKVNNFLKTTKFDFCVFAEKNSIKEELKPYYEIYKRIVNRNTLRPADGIMFFDYPPSDDIMHDIMERVNPVRIHYMSYDLNKAMEFDYIQTFMGMIRYVCNKKNGIFDLNNSACFLGITNDMTEVLLDLFNDCGGIKILERADDYFRISYLRTPLKSELRNNENYEIFNNLLEKTFILKRHYLECTIEELTAEGFCYQY